MTQAEQASLEAVRLELNNAVKEIRADVKAGFTEVRQLMESRRIEEVRVQEQLQARIKEVDSRVDDYDKARSIAEAFFSFGKWLAGTVVVVLGLVFAYLSMH